MRLPCMHIYLKSTQYGSNELGKNSLISQLLFFLASRFIGNRFDFRFT